MPLPSSEVRALLAAGILSALTVGGALPARSAETCPLSPDECAALRFLDFVAAPMAPAAEKEWWDVGGRQFGVFAKRYNIAFVGYAAAAIGLRADGEGRRMTGRILARCLERMLSRDVWAYSQSKKYWGRKPWAPDPCYRENVMYTGHLLQLLALYESFTGDRRYWTNGWDFVWSDGRRVHYDVGKLIGVTVEQMHANASGGVTCEPGFLFFPCNNHPHVALKIFSRLGHGDWTAEARKWERWALENFPEPFFGGGVFKLCRYAPVHMFYPRGQSALDGWSLLWYEPWAEKRETATGLWKQAAARLDWKTLDAAEDVIRGGGGCRDPLAVPASVACVFLAAAARACDDPTTAARLERAVDVRYLVRKDGLYYLNLNREWRIGASAQRILSLALEKGSSFRD